VTRAVLPSTEPDKHALGGQTRDVVTSGQFRRIALSFPESVEGQHMGHPDFRAFGRIFATIGPDGTWGMVKLTPVQQSEFIAVAPATFRPASGAWGRQGSTLVQFDAARTSVVRRAMSAAWQNLLLGQGGRPLPRADSLRKASRTK
jgi:hypothetical protein